ncbi:MAG: TlpA family protein disulfide reductase [Anaerolineae bacterium]|nr:TlpA family protein disulfide reductase [Anaerolineae bacterium]
MESLTQGDSVKVPTRGFSPASIVLLAGLVLFAAVVGMQLAARNSTQPTSGPAPDFELTTFDGGKVRLSDLRGRVVVVNFWASWCGPCRDEAPVLQNLWEQYREQGVMLIGVDYADVESDALAFIQEFGITYPNGPDLGTRISEDYHIQGVPETFVIDQEGNVAQFVIAPIQSGQLEPTIDRLLAREETVSS